LPYRGLFFPAKTTRDIQAQPDHFHALTSWVEKMVNKSIVPSEGFQYDLRVYLPFNASSLSMEVILCVAISSFSERMLGLNDGFEQGHC
jgi:hypothetical protein